MNVKNGAFVEDVNRGAICEIDLPRVGLLRDPQARACHVLDPGGPSTLFILLPAR